MFNAEGLMPSSEDATMGASEIKSLCDTLNLAEGEVRRGKAPLALRLLKDIKSTVEAHPGTELSANHSLLVAEALAAKALRNDDSAASFFEEALQQIANLPSRKLELEMRAHESYGQYLMSALHRCSAARMHLEAAKAIAVQWNLRERTAEIQLKLIRIDLEADKDPQLLNFGTLRRVASSGDQTPEEELAAWNQHLGLAGKISGSVRYARNEQSASEAYFRNLLDSVRLRF